MTSKIKDGWHTVCGYYVYVEGGNIIRGIYDGATIYPYRSCPEGGWDMDAPVSVSAFRSGVARGTKAMF